MRVLNYTKRSNENELLMRQLLEAGDEWLEGGNRPAALLCYIKAADMVRSESTLVS